MDRARGAPRRSHGVAEPSKRLNDPSREQFACRGRLVWEARAGRASVERRGRASTFVQSRVRASSRCSGARSLRCARCDRPPHSWMVPWHSRRWSANRLSQAHALHQSQVYGATAPRRPSATPLGIAVRMDWRRMPRSVGLEVAVIEVRCGNRRMGAAPREPRDALVSVCMGAAARELLVRSRADDRLRRIGREAVDRLRRELVGQLAARERLSLPGAIPTAQRLCSVRSPAR